MQQLSQSSRWQEGSGKLLFKGDRAWTEQEHVWRGLLQLLATVNSAHLRVSAHISSATPGSATGGDGYSSRSTHPFHAADLFGAYNVHLNCSLAFLTKTHQF